MGIDESVNTGLEQIAVEKPDINTMPFALAGRIVTMAHPNEAKNADDRVVEDGVIFIEDGVIKAIRKRADGPAPGFEQCPTIETKATLYPGLIDLHNHLSFNICPLWRVPKLYKNRNEWRTDPDYEANVKGPAQLLAGNLVMAPAMARYVEAKALANGTTTGQGMRIQGLKGEDVFRGAMRNVEAPNDGRLRGYGAQTHIPDLNVRSQKEVDTFRTNLEAYRAFFYHLCEGRDEAARQNFLNLEGLDFVKPSLVGIHALALTKSDYAKMSAAQAKIVWSPFSNMLLYGSTLNLRDLLDTNNFPALGCDWSPSGSKGLLEELKVARWAADSQFLGDDVTDENIVQMVTSSAALVLGWQDFVGTLQEGRFADILAIAGTDGDPYTKLVMARERDVQIVAIDGVPRYGDPQLVRRALAVGLGVDESDLDVIRIDETQKAFYLRMSNSTLKQLTVSAATELLQQNVGDLYNLPTAPPSQGIAPMDVEDGFTLVLDDVDGGGSDEDFGQGLAPMAVAPPAKSIQLDSFAVDRTHLKAVAQQNNLPQGLTRYLCECYGVDLSSLL